MQKRSSKDTNVIAANIVDRTTDKARIVKNPAAVVLGRLAGRARADYHLKDGWR